MKLTTLIALILAYASTATGQSLTILTPIHRALYPFENFYQFQVKNLPCSKIVIKADQGQITQNGCEFVYRPASAGYAVFRAYLKTRHGLSLVDTVVFGVSVNDQIYPGLGPHYGGPINKSEALAIGGILLEEFVNDSHAEFIHLISYKIIFIHGDSISSIRNIGNRFSSQALAMLRTMQTNDKLIIVDVQASDFRRSSVSVRPVEFTIE